MKQYGLYAAWFLLSGIGPYFLAMRFYRRSPASKPKSRNIALSVLLFAFCFAVASGIIFVVAVFASLMIWGR